MSSGIVESSTGSSGSSDREQTQQVQRSRLVARLLAASPDLPSFLTDLITTQAVVVAGTEAAAFVIRRGEQTGFILDVAAHVRPDGADEEVRQQALAAFKELVFPCVQQNRDGAIEIAAGDGVDESQFCLVTLLRSEGAVVAVSAVITRCRDVERAQQRLVSMQLVAGYFDLYMLRRKSEQALQLAQTHQDVLQYATAVGTAETFQQSAVNLCNALANRTGAVRVSLGWLKGVNIKVKALSHTENFDKRQELITSLQRVMEEAADQDEPVYYNPTPEVGEPSTPNVTREAAAFSRQQAGNSVLSVPLRRHGELVGVLTLEWAAKTALPPGAVQAMTVAADVLAPQLYDRFQNDRWLITKAGLSARELTKKAIGPKYMVSKLVCTLLLAAMLVLVLYQPMFRVAAPFQFATTDKRVLSAPFDGFLGELGLIDGRPVRAGMAVSQGQLLASMDTTDRELQRVEALSRSAALAAQARAALAEGKAAEAQIALEQKAGVDARVRVLESEIERARIRAPFDGYILRSEADDRRGGQVRAGELLFEVARIDELRVELAVNERDVGMLRVGQKGELATTSLPGQKYPFTITRIVPQGQAREGANVFTVYAELDGPIKETWRPGMAGEARIDIEPKPLYYHWTHRLVNWVRLKLWL